MDPKQVQEVLHLQPPPKLDDRTKRINDRRNRNMRNAMIINVIQHFATSVNKDPENFGLAWLYVNGSFYFYGVMPGKGNYTTCVNVESFPTSYVKDTLIAFADTYAPTAVGVYVGAAGIEFLYVDEKGLYRSKDKK